MPQKEFRQRRQIHLKGFEYSSHRYIFFVTMCTVDKQRYFCDSNISEVIIKELEYRRLSREIKLFCYCIMPDHLHILISLEEGYTKRAGAFGERTLQNWISAFKRHTSRMVVQRCNIKPLWQSNFYDHVVRNEESLVDICNYILNNPVRKGIVSAIEEYPYSKMVDPLPI